MLIDASLKLQTLEEAQAVASMIAKACPNPRLAAVGICELLINAIEHGNLGIGFAEKSRLTQAQTWLDEIERRLSLPDNSKKFVDVNFYKDQKTIKIKISDQGNGFDWHKYQDLDHSRIYERHGRGIAMAKHLTFNTMQYLGNGSQVECIIEL